MNRVWQILIMILSSVAIFEGSSLLLCAFLQVQTDALIAFATTETDRSPKALQPEIRDQVSRLCRFSSLPGSVGPMRKTIGGLLAAVAFENEGIEANRKEILEAEPASGADWLKLAALRTKRLGSDEAVFSAVGMSELTEPREIDVVVRRAIFYLSMWEALPSERQRRALNELSDAAPFMEVTAIGEIKLAIKNMTQTQRQVIRERLVARAAGEKAWMKAIGL